MRIIGGKDFYDINISFGQDPKNILIRNSFDKSEPINSKKIPESFSKKISIKTNANYEYNIKPLHVFIAGKIYGFVYITKHNSYRYGPISEEIFIWDKETLIKEFKKINIEIKKREKNDNNSYYSKKYNRIYLDNLDEFFERKITKEEETFFIDNKIWSCIPDLENIIYNREEIWKINTDGLEKIKFNKKIDPYTLYQEISMWNSNVLTKTEEDKMVKIKDEKTLIKKHGFDNWSFKKMPSNF